MARPRRRPWLVWLWPVIGLASLAWFLVRVLPKPSRASYPCQRVAAPLASSFVLWLLGVTGSLAAFRWAGRRAREARYALAAVFAVMGLVAAGWALVHAPARTASAFTPIDPPNSPMGVARGCNPGRVVWVRDPAATSWGGSSGYYWEDRYTDQAAVDRMMGRAVREMAGAATDAAAWDALFRSFNQAHGRGNVGYQAGEKVVLKINLNNCTSYSARNNNCDTSPQVLRALLRQLVHRAGVAPAAITAYDSSRYITDKMWSGCHAEFPEVRFADAAGSYGRAKAVADPKTPIRYGQPIAGTPDHPPACVTEAAYLINVAALKKHSLAAVTLCAKNHFGSLCKSPAHLHGYVGTQTRPMGTFTPLVDLQGHAQLGGKTLLFVIDGLYGAPGPSSNPVRWKLPPFNGDWPSSLLVSQDAAAIDSVGLDFLLAEWGLYNNADNYLHEAALANAPPSGTFYDPEGDGTRLASLGVHEHWNNATAKKYSRNLGTGNGIDLVGPTDPRFAHMEVLPAGDLDFGRVYPGEAGMAQDAYTVRNTGGGQLDLAVSVAPPFYVLADDGSPLGQLPCTIPPGGQKKLSFSFEPPDAQPCAETISFASNDGTEERTARGVRFSTLRLDFGTSASPLAAGYERVTASTAYNASLGYGWRTGGLHDYSRPSGSALDRDFVYGGSGTFGIAVPDGEYRVTVTMGDRGIYLHDRTGVFLEGTKVDEVTTAAGEVAERTYSVRVSDGELTAVFQNLGGTDPNFVLNGLTVDWAGPDTKGPAVVGSSPTGNVSGPVDRVRLTFGEPIVPATFGKEDVMLLGPGGPVSLTSVSPARRTLRLDFGSAGSPVADGYLPVTRSTVYNASPGYGWRSGSVADFSRSTGSDLDRDFNYGRDATFAVALPNGTYSVTLTLGDRGIYPHDQVGVILENVAVDEVSTAAGEVVERTYSVAVTDGELTLRLLSLGGSDPNFVLNGLVVDGASTTDFEVCFDPQTAVGDYQLALGPDVEDAKGNPMNQDGDGTNGTVPSDCFATAFTILPWSRSFDFGTPTSPVAPGYIPVTPSTVYGAALGYGWRGSVVIGYSRPTGGALDRDFNYARQGTFAVAVPSSGSYRVILTLGDRGTYAHDHVGVFLEGTKVDEVSTAAGEVVANSYTVSVLDGELTVELRSLGGIDPNFVVNGLVVTLVP